MRVGVTQTEQTMNTTSKITINQAEYTKANTVEKVDSNLLKNSKSMNVETITKEKLEKAVTAINDVLETENKSSKFVLHEGLGQYYVKLVDPETEEVIKEIPPESLLNAYYEMKKLAGMIVDEKI